jgi:hypothetical protein
LAGWTDFFVEKGIFVKRPNQHPNTQRNTSTIKYFNYDILTNQFFIEGQNQQPRRLAGIFNGKKNKIKIATLLGGKGENH